MDAELDEALSRGLSGVEPELREALRIEAERWFTRERADRAPGPPTASEWHDLIAVHFAVRVTRPGRELQAGLRAVAGALEGEAAAAVREAAAQLPRLEKLCRALNETALEGRPKATLYRKDPAAYAAAMRAWEQGRPRVSEPVEARWVIEEVLPHSLVLRAPRARLELQVARRAKLAARAGDALQASIGTSGGEPCLVECFSVGAKPRAWTGS